MVSGTLFIQPESQEMFPFAEPLNTEKTFEVKAGVKAVLQAKEIQLFPGVELKAGAEVEVKSTTNQRSGN
jgi:D-aminopeptidase